MRVAFDSVSRCPNVRLCLETLVQHPCRKIVEYQRKEFGIGSYDEFQLPEPWVGEIDIAPILFVSSNPSIGEDTHARGGSVDEDVWESHHLAFGGARRRYIDEGIRTVGADGTKLKTVRYWSGTRARARELIVHRDVIPGKDYALTEIVHCKSRDEYGVKEAAKTCAATHMEAVMKVAAARVIISVGAFARDWFLGGLPIPASPVKMEFAGHARLVVFTPHFSPGRGGPRTLAKRYSGEDMHKLIAAVGLPLS